jgi:hypothetical protein
VRFITLLMLILASMSLNAVAQQAAVAQPPFVVEQTYWIKAGKELQFIGLFEKNRVPLLRAKIKEGRVLWVRLSRPPFNATNDQWDLRVTVAWRDAESALEPITQAKTQLTTEQQIIEELIVQRTDVPIQEWSVSGTSN